MGRVCPIKGVPAFRAVNEIELSKWLPTAPFRAEKHHRPGTPPLELRCVDTANEGAVILRHQVLEQNWNRKCLGGREVLLDLIKALEPFPRRGVDVRFLDRDVTEALPVVTERTSPWGSVADLGRGPR